MTNRSVVLNGLKELIVRLSTKNKIDHRKVSKNVFEQARGVYLDTLEIHELACAVPSDRKGIALAVLLGFRRAQEKQLQDNKVAFETYGGKMWLAEEMQRLEARIETLETKLENHIERISMREAARKRRYPRACPVLS